MTRDMRWHSEKKVAGLFWLAFALLAALYLAARTVERREYVLDQ